MQDDLSDTALVIAAGGSSTRFGGDNKLLVHLNGIPLFAHSILRAAPLLPEEGGRIVMAVPPGQEGRFFELAEEFLPGIRIEFVKGGENRLESVLHALEHLDSSRIRIAAVHDAARPMLNPDLLRKTVEEARRHGGALVCRKICDTVKWVNGASGVIERTVPRDCLWGAETPQCFELSLLLPACRKALAAGFEATDEASVMEHFSDVRPVVVENRDPNPKITYREDLTATSVLLPLFPAQESSCGME